MSQEIVLQVDAVGDACRPKAMNAVAHLHGVNSMKFDGEKLTVVGDVDVVCVVNKLKKAMFSPVVLSVGPVKAAKVQEKAPETPKENPPCCEGCRCGCRLLLRAAATDAGAAAICILRLWWCSAGTNSRPDAHPLMLARLFSLSVLCVQGRRLFRL
ncbi:hypothetical protein EJB05_06465 [Eragrostis curvula]|uniref:HMA domain-containing protein n=1 Tax=Eragrostis curvula TaxID=38414 RepID=A0A5J9WDU5_9POAL|nr:hypothetical protein EJB05_06465 [Eragrostis curvula]